MFKYYIIEMKPGNRMLRIGFGYNECKFFVRLDFWKYGIRLTK